jgi:iron complex transport system permease protein
MTTQEETTTSGDSVERPSSAGVVLAVVGLLWMAGLLWSARATITGQNDAELEVTSTAYALPGVISASLVGGAAVALAVLAAAGRGRALGATLRFAIATGTGLVLGLLGAVTIITINRDGWVYAVGGATVAAAATIGGALAGFRAPRVLAAVCWASIAVFAVGVVLNFVPWLDLFGSGGSTSSQFGAASWFSLTQRVLSGLAAGLVSYRVLRRAGRRAGGVDLRWPWYALAGAGPGLLLILAEGLARTAGARVLDLAGRVSELETTVQRMLSGSRLNSALIVMFIGAVTAIIAVGRTLGPAADEDPASDDA